MLLLARVLTGFGLLSLSALPVIHAAAPNAIGIKFVGRGSLLGRGETAGVVPAANWNNAIGLRGESALVDAAGVATGVTVAWAAQAMGNLLLSDTPGNPRLMLGYLDTLGTAPTTISVSNLPAWAPGYYVYVYADGYSGTFTRTAVYRLAGAVVRVTDNTDFTGAFTLANGSPGNYALFTVQGGTFTLTAEAAYSTDRFLRAPVNAIQIVPAAAGDFIVASNPVEQSLAPGGSVTRVVTVSADSGFTGTVGLSATGLPRGVTASFSPASITGSGSAVLTMSADSGAQPSAAAFTVSAASGRVAHTASANLTVLPARNAVAPRVISIDFVGRGTPMRAEEIAGAARRAHWNAAEGLSSAAPLPLVDETGASTGATVTWSAETAWSLPLFDEPGNTRMMAGYLDTRGAIPTVVTVAGLPAASYELYVYFDGENRSTTRTGLYRVNNISHKGVDAASADFRSTLAWDVNYLKFQVEGTMFTLTASALESEDAYLSAPVNGIQIVPAAATRVARVSPSPAVAGR